MSERIHFQPSHRRENRCREFVKNAALPTGHVFARASQELVSYKDVRGPATLHRRVWGGRIL